MSTLHPDPLVNAILLLAGAVGIGGLLIRRSAKSARRIVGAAMIWDTMSLLFVAWYASARFYHMPVSHWIFAFVAVALFVIPGITYWRVRAELAAAGNAEAARRLNSIDSSFGKYAKIAVLSLPLGSCAYILGSILGSTGEGWSPSSDAGKASALLAVVFAWLYVSRQESRHNNGGAGKSHRRVSH
jgi:hypothetical protein